MRAMMQIDRERERQRLADLYAGKSDLELSELSQDALSLTEDARGMLRAEFLRRGLKMEPAKVIVSAGEPDLKIVTIRRFLYLPDALAAKSALESAGIECFLADENTVRIDWLWSNLLGGIKLWVKVKDAPEADELLAQDFSQELEGGGGEG
jgi:Putative prokaryotic signal transducing protein